MSLSNGLKNAGKYKDLIILLDESTSIKVSISLLGLCTHACALYFMISIPYGPYDMGIRRVGTKYE